MGHSPPPIGVSGAPPREGDCQRCRTPFRGLDLTTPGRLPGLRGTDRLRDRSLGKLRVCRRCERLWREHYDSRERYFWYEDLGFALHLLAPDGTGPALVQWTARQMTPDSSDWLQHVLAARLKRQPEQVQPSFEAILQALAAPITQPTAVAAERRLALVRLARCVVELAVAAGELDMTPPPAADAAVRQACKRAGSGNHPALAYRGKTSALMRQTALLAEARIPVANRNAPLNILDLSPLIAAALPQRLAAEPAGYARGVRLRNGFQWLTVFREQGGRWRGDGLPLSMPAENWQRLDAALDPVPLLSDGVEQLLAHQDAEPEVRRDVIQEQAERLPVLAEAGARIGAEPLRCLQQLHERLDRSASHPDTVAAQALWPLIARFERLAAGDCRSMSGDCARG